MNVLKINEVYKNLGKREIIKGISLSVDSGEIFGFLGPNGAGKTTTIKMMVGLIRPDKGSIQIAGSDILNHGDEARAQIGAVVENPEMYNYLSGMANLKLIAEVRMIPKRSIDEVVELVDLSDRINDKVGKYSLGMKQRLGLACALLSKPKLLVLDEPTNGLDPSGIIDFRDIVKKTVQETGTSVFISSHILSEVQQLCTKVAFINHGEIKGIENVVNGSVDNNGTEIFIIRTSPLPQILELLRSIKAVKNVSLQEGMYSVVAKKSTSPEIIKTLVSENIDVYEVYQKHNSLEQRYMELVEGGK
ncbi:MAG: ABC transporter ATP-binding protein [Eubacteriales bacterium]